MRKIWALYQNELIKISRKVSILVLLLVMLAVIFGFGAINKLSLDNYFLYEDDSEWLFQLMETQLEEHEKEIEGLNKRLEVAGEEELPFLREELAKMEIERDVLQLGLKERIPYEESDSYLSAALHQLVGYRTQIFYLEQAIAAEPQEENALLLRQYQSYVERLLTIAEKPDYAAYLDLQNNIIRDDPEYTEEERNILLESNALLLKADPNGENKGYALREKISEIEAAKRSLLYNINYLSQDLYHSPLSAEQRREIEDQLAVMVYQTEHGMVSLDRSYYGLSLDVVESIFSAGLFLIVIMMLILAGGSISQEISTGSIKSLIISPTKRWKIYTAKLLSLVTVGVIATLIAYGATMLTNLIFFGNDFTTAYVYASSGTAHEMNFYLYQLANAFISYLDVFVYTVFAFLLSIMTRNTAASVGLSIGVYFGGSLGMTFVNAMFRGEWVKFLPFAHLSLHAKFFPFAASGVDLSGAAGGMTTSLLFSLIYLAVFLVCMLWTAYDGFVRRDL